jgi:hypothetical protein
MIRRILLLLLAFLFMGCAKTYDRQVEFIQEEYAPYEGTGTARICGQAYLSLDAGKQHIASEDRVLLAPVTSYTEEAFKVKVMGGQKMEDPDPKAMKFEKHTKTDDDGRFCFTDLPGGEYYVVLAVNIMWWLILPYRLLRRSIVKANWLMPKPRLRRMKTCMFL